MDKMFVILLLLFFIICFTVIIWLQSKSSTTRENPGKKEGFQVTTGADSGRNIELGRQVCGNYKDAGMVFGQTATDIYYDIYERNELNAATRRIQSMSAAQSTISSNSAPLMPDPNASTCDPNTPITWDTDNATLDPTNVLWGVVSKEASKSIAQKNCVIESLATAVPCGSGTDGRFCYHSTMFNINVHDPALATALNFAQQSVMALGQTMLPLQGSPTFQSIKQDWTQLKAARKMLLTNPKEFVATGARGMTTALVQVGDSINTALGRRVFQTMEEYNEKIRIRQAEQLTEFRSNTRNNLNSGKLTAGTKAIDISIKTLRAVSAAAIAAAAFTFGLSLLAQAATFLAILALVSVKFYLSILPVVLMFAESLVEPIMRATFKSGGVCPPGFHSFSASIGSGTTLEMLNAFVPGVSTISMLDPYICWSNVIEKNAELLAKCATIEAFSFGIVDTCDFTSILNDLARPKVFPIKPSYIYDRSLSIIYHSSWMAGVSGTTPPPPPQPTNTPTSGSGSTVFPFEPVTDGWELIPDTPFIGTICPPYTDASGVTCIASSVKIDVQLPILSACDSTDYDDGTNCWSSNPIISGCTGGQQIVPSNIYDDTTGYYKILTTPFTCSGTAPTIKKTYFQRMTCNTGYTSSGFLCYANCRDPVNYTRNGAQCISNVKSFSRTLEAGNLKIRKRTELYAPPRPIQEYVPYNSETPLSALPFPWCDYADPKMLDKMAQFYNTYSMQNPEITYNTCGEMQSSVQEIVKFYGVIASSELSCDVACSILFRTYDPITGSTISIKLGCSYPDDEEFENYHFCYRRFYFVYSDQTKEFIVTGCTHADYTAPDGMVKSFPATPTTPVQDNFLISLSEPSSSLTSTSTTKNSNGSSGSTSAKTFVATSKRDKSTKDLNNLVNTFKNGSMFLALGGATAGNILMLKGGQKAGELAGKLGGRLLGGFGGVIAGLAGGAIAGAAIGMGVQEANERTIRAVGGISPPEPKSLDYSDFTQIVTLGGYNYIMTNDVDWQINHGVPYEMTSGYTPNFTPCVNITVNAAYCTHKYVIRNMVDKYHTENPGKRLESINVIEPRGNFGCYYKCMEYTYDTATKQRNADSYVKELVQVHDIANTDTCTFRPISFDINIDDYPIRSVVDPMTNRTFYPFNVTQYTSDLMARYVRIRPPIGASSSRLQVSAIEIYDVSGGNVALNSDKTFSSSTDPEYADGASLVNGDNVPGESKLNIWAPSSTDTNPYWEVDLGKNTNIAEVVYYGGNLAGTNHIGVRIEFLYSNASNETPILTKILNADMNQGNTNSIYLVPLYASSKIVSKYPVSGPIKLPPLETSTMATSKYIGDPRCIQRCEDITVMNHFIQQYNNTNNDTQIMRIFRGTNTSDTASCEYEVEMKTIADTVQNRSIKAIRNGSGSGSGSESESNNDTSKIPFTIEKQYVNMTVGLESTQPHNVVLGRYVRILPNRSATNVLEISHIVVTGLGSDNKTYNVSANANINCNNELAIFGQMGDSSVIGNQCVRSVVNGYKATQGSTRASFDPEYYPNLYIAKNNTDDTFYDIDLLQPWAVAQILFVGRTNVERVPGGIEGIKVQIYLDNPGQQNARPIFTYTLPTDDVFQTVDVVSPMECAFKLQSTKILENPVYLNMSTQMAGRSLVNNDNLYTYNTIEPDPTNPCLPRQCKRLLNTTSTVQQDETTTPDTYEQIPGVGAVSNIMSSLKSTWNSFLPKESEDLVAPIASNLKLANSSVQNMADTVSEMQRIAGTDKRCKDKEVLTNIMMHYNNLNAPKQDGTIAANTTKDAAEKLQQQYGPTKKTMLRILKAGQSTPNTCDIMYEESVDMYDDYIEDIVNKDYNFKQVKAVRFVMNGVVPDSDPKRVTDISANALGIMSDKTVVNPPFSSKDISPACMIDCRDPNIIQEIRARVNSNKHTGSDAGGAYTETYTLKSIKNSFQPSPYVCEYTIMKDGVQKYNTRNATYADPDIETYVRAVFSTDPAPTCTQSIVKIDEYDPEFVTWTNDNYPAKYKGVNTIIPYIYSYNPVDPTKKDPKNLQKNSVRVNSQSQNI